MALLVETLGKKVYYRRNTTCGPKSEYTHYDPIGTAQLGRYQNSGERNGTLDISFLEHLGQNHRKGLEKTKLKLPRREYLFDGIHIVVNWNEPMTEAINGYVSNSETALI